MKKALLVTAICGMMVAGTAFSQPSAQLSFSGPGTVGQNGTFTLNTTLTYSDFQSYGLSYWLEIPNAPASFFHITAETFLVFNDPQQPGWPNEFNFPMAHGVDRGFMATSNDLGATTLPLTLVPPGTYTISNIAFQLTNAPVGTYTFYSTSIYPRPSIVTDQDFADVSIPRASFTITVVPEPSTLALLGIGAVGSGMLIYRRRKHRLIFCSTNDQDVI